MLSRRWWLMDEYPPLVPMIGALLRAPLRVIGARVATDVAAAGYTDLRPAYLAVFQHLSAEGDRVTTLAERAQMTKQSMGYLVEHLERGNYVERVIDPQDQRARLVRRTARGWGVERTARASIARIEEEWAARIGAERLAALRDILTEVASLADAPTAR
jgi:DNA-binding MarR family transcriptional regulator